MRLSTKLLFVVGPQTDGARRSAPNETANRSGAKPLTGWWPVILQGVRKLLKSYVTNRRQPDANGGQTVTNRRWRIENPRRSTRLYSKHGTVVLGGQHVQQAIRSLTHVADALFQFAEHRFAPDLLPAFIELDALHLTRRRRLALAQAADEKVALPAGEHVP